MPARQSDSAQLQPGQTAVAPNIDDPRAFAVHNGTSELVTIFYSFDEERHLVTVMIEAVSPSGPPRGDGSSSA